MGTTRYYTDHHGEEQGLYDHEGYVEAELDIENPLVPERGRWAAHSGPDVVGHFTGRQRAACECGWRGPVFEPGATSLWLEEVDLKRASVALPEDFYDAIMAAWDEHVDQVLAELTALAPISEWDRKLRQARAELDQAVAAARIAGQSWEAIGRALGVTRQGAWERYRHLEPA